MKYLHLEEWSLLVCWRLCLAVPSVPVARAAKQLAAGFALAARLAKAIPNVLDDARWDAYTQ